MRMRRFLINTPLLESEIFYVVFRKQQNVGVFLQYFVAHSLNFGKRDFIIRENSGL